MAYNTATIRQLLIAALDDETLNTYCFAHARPVHKQFVVERGVWKGSLPLSPMGRDERSKSLMCGQRDIVRDGPVPARGRL